ncbi:MAG: ACT domain-containing protein, partial [Syntrophobacteraceae bacterium]|nr:ACT domain-containing protein [Syntrophobacteraceae bacterium]
LTIADSRATGPGAWNTWKASLLRELFVKVERVLLRGEMKTDDVKERSERVAEKVLARVKDEEERRKIRTWFDKLSFRYILSQDPDSILEHFSMEQELPGQDLVMRARQTEGEMWQVTVATRDRPGLFAMITGALWARGLNILSADIFTRQSGIALDVLIVERLPDPLHPDELWNKVKVDLVRSLTDRSYLDEILINKRKPSFLRPKGLPRKNDRVLIDEDASDFYTIIEVYTRDRPGVLHSITNTLYELGLTIQLAKISTPGAQVADVFYVTDLNGNKLMDYEMHEKTRDALLKCLSLLD